MSSEEESDEEFDYSDDECENDDVAMEDAGELKLESIFDEAQDISRKEPNKSIEMFDEIVQLEKESGTQGSWSFKALIKTILLLFSTKNLESVTERLTNALKLSNEVPQSETAAQVQLVLQCAQDYYEQNPNEPLDQLVVFFNTAIDQISATRDERLWFTLQVKLGKIYLSNNRLADVEKLLNLLLNKLDDNPQKFSSESFVVEIYFLEISYYQKKDDVIQIKRCYGKVLEAKTAAAFDDPRIMGPVYEIGGKLDMQEHRWTGAYNKFLDAFKSYQTFGNPHAKQILKYVLLANMIALKDINPFDSAEAKAYQDDQELKDMVKLRQAYDVSDITKFEGILQKKSAGIKDDPYMMKYVHKLLRNIRKRVLLEAIAPYDKVSFLQLARCLNSATTDVVESLLVELILEKKLDAEIDQVEKVVYQAFPADDAQLQNDKMDVLLKIAESFSAILDAKAKAKNVLDIMNKPGLSDHQSLRPKFNFI